MASNLEVHWHEDVDTGGDSGNTNEPVQVLIERINGLDFKASIITNSAKANDE